MAKYKNHDKISKRKFESHQEINPSPTKRKNLNTSFGGSDVC